MQHTTSKISMYKPPNDDFECCCAIHIRSPDSLRFAVVGTAHDDVQGELVVILSELRIHPPCGLLVLIALTALLNTPVFLELEQERVFEEFRIESQSENCVLFEIDMTLLNTALVSCKVRSEELGCG